jgi:hypothetical protein
MIVDMKRVLALALVGGALLLGGCDRSTAAPPPAESHATPPPPAESHATPAASATTSGNSDVDSLLGDVDKQLSSDDQPPADQD